MAIVRGGRCGGTVPFSRDCVLYERVGVVDARFMIGIDNGSVNTMIVVMTGHNVILGSCFGF